MLNHFRNHLAAGKHSPGLIIVAQGTAIGSIIEGIILFWAATDSQDWRDQAYHLPSLIRHVFNR